MKTNKSTKSTAVNTTPTQKFRAWKAQAVALLTKELGMPGSVDDGDADQTFSKGMTPEQFVGAIVGAEINKKVAKKSTAKTESTNKPAADAKRISYADKKIVALKKEHDAREGTKRAKALDLMLHSAKTTSELLPKLKKIGADASFIHFAVIHGFIKLS